jgi:uncharacterized lipoprotein YajG
MRHLLLIALSATLFLFAGCTKQETKQNLKNVNEGLKNSWIKTKKSFSKATEAFKEETEKL